MVHRAGIALVIIGKNPQSHPQVVVVDSLGEQLIAHLLEVLIIPSQIAIVRLLIERYKIVLSKHGH